VLCVSRYPQRPLLQVYELSGGALVWSRFLDGIEPSSVPILSSKHLLLLNGPVVITTAPSASLARLFFKVSFGGQKLTYSCLYERNDELVHLGDGFVATAGNQIVLGSASGKVTRALTPDDLGIPAPGPYRRLVSWPRAGRFAIGDPRNFLILADQDAKLVAVTRQSMKFSDLAFIGPDALVTANRDPDGQIALTRWTRDGDELVPTRPTMVRTSWAHGLHVIPGLGRIIVSDIPDRETDHWLEQDTLAPADPPEELRTVRCHSLRVHGDWVAVHGPAGVDLYRYGPAPERLALAIRPMGTMRLGELATVAAAEQQAGDPDHRILLSLVRACLEHRFAHEIEIGPDGLAAAGEYDIRIE
jgi:hypothetical protein